MYFIFLFYRFCASASLVADLQRAGDCAGLVRLLLQLLQERGRAPQGELAALEALSDLAELPGLYGSSVWLLGPVISALATAVRLL